MFPDDVTRAKVKETLAQIDDDKNVDLIIGSISINPTAGAISDLEAAGADPSDEVIAGLPPTDLIADLQIGKRDDQLLFAPVLSQQTLLETLILMSILLLTL